MPYSIIFKISFLITIAFSLASCGGDHEVKMTKKVICEGTRTLAVGDYIVCHERISNIIVLKVEARALSGEQTVEIITIPGKYIEQYERVLKGQDKTYKGEFGWYPDLGISPLTTEGFTSDWIGTEAASVIIENTNAGNIQPKSGEVQVEYKVMAEYN